MTIKSLKQAQRIQAHRNKIGRFGVAKAVRRWLRKNKLHSVDLGTNMVNRRPSMGDLSQTTEPTRS